MQLKTPLTFGKPGEQVTFPAGTPVVEATDDEIAAGLGEKFVVTPRPDGSLWAMLGGKIRVIFEGDVND